MESCRDLSDVELGDQIVVWAGRIAAGLARQLVLIAEFDRREAWAGPGLLSCAHWLQWRTGLGAGAAREQVRVSRALATLPVVLAAMQEGRVSYSQARAITRVAQAGDEQRWVDLARCSTAGQLERLVRGIRRARRVDEDAADPELAAHRMRTRVSYDEDGTMVMTVRLPAEDGAVLTAALHQVAAQLDHERADAARADVGRAAPDDVSAETPTDDHSAETPEDDVYAETHGEEENDSDHESAIGMTAQADVADRRAPRATVLEALLRMARASLSAAPPAVARRGRWALQLQVDPVSGWARLPDGELLPPTSLEAVRRTLPGRAARERLRPVRAADLTRYDAGRTRRLPPMALRELVGVLDGERCRFPGCTRTSRLDAHHVTFWRDGGRTDLGNLVLLCGRHHTLVHRDGFALELLDDRRLTVHTATGVPVLHHPALPWRPAAELDPAATVTPRTLPPDRVEARMDLRYAVMVMMQQAA